MEILSYIIIIINFIATIYVLFVVSSRVNDLRERAKLEEVNKDLLNELNKKEVIKQEINKTIQQKVIEQEEQSADEWYEKMMNNEDAN